MPRARIENKIAEYKTFNDFNATNSFLDIKEEIYNNVLIALI